ncbi:hypothetical protein FG379_003451 [Cryptosporidium bovis]|uniref:uncharacterized protein n=1 Tax=Cryptosporidium bovis TaxID=310047 RepID=UPI003519FF40|nr:hypothetical protein FG379_003451 [Cryptosporidium bovis]
MLILFLLQLTLLLVISIDFSCSIGSHNYNIRSNDNGLLNDDLDNIDGCEKYGLCSEYYNFCSEPRIFENIRKIPKINDKDDYKTLELIQVQSIIRHGARTPTKYHKCWKGLVQSWNCDELITTVQASAYDVRNNTQTLEFSKHYDIRQWENNLNGTCKMGQLISQGYEQHRINGRIIANAYFKSSKNGNNTNSLVTKNGLIIGNNYRDEIYIRSSDMQRTTVSAAALFTSLLEEVVGKDVTFKEFQKFPLHTMDIQSDYLFANANVENLTDHLRSALNSNEYFNIVDKHQKLYEELELNVKTNRLKDLWPGDLMDCIMTTVCTGNYKKLPKGFVNNNLLNRTISAIEEELFAIYTWNDSILSKSEMSRLLYDIREYILNIILYYEHNDNNHNLNIICNNQIIGNININANSSIIEPLCDKYNELKLNNILKINTPKFILFSGHDTTIIPTLASLKLWDNHWPPYASTFIIELYKKPNLHENNDDLEYIIPYFFRLLYNGEVVTTKIKSCNSNEVCHVS